MMNGKTIADEKSYDSSSAFLCRYQQLPRNKHRNTVKKKRKMLKSQDFSVEIYCNMPQSVL